MSSSLFSNMEEREEERDGGETAPGSLPLQARRRRRRTDRVPPSRPRGRRAEGRSRRPSLFLSRRRGRPTGARKVTHPSDRAGAGDSLLLLLLLLLGSLPEPSRRQGDALGLVLQQVHLAVVDVDLQDVLELADVLDHALDHLESVELLLQGLPGVGRRQEVPQLVQVEGDLEVVLAGLGDLPAPDGREGVHGGLANLRLHDGFTKGVSAEFL